MNKEIQAYNKTQSAEEIKICNLLAEEIDKQLKNAESKIWHGHPVWFLDANPIVGYSKQKAGIRLMFWSGADFDEELLNVRGEKFKDASVFYTMLNEIKVKDLKRWLKKGKEIQWDYKNLVKRKGVLLKVGAEAPIKDGDKCIVIAGTHKGKSGTVRDINTSKTGHVTITVVQASGIRFKTLAKNVEVSNTKVK